MGRKGIGWAGPELEDKWMLRKDGCGARQMAGLDQSGRINGWFGKTVTKKANRWVGPEQGGEWMLRKHAFVSGGNSTAVSCAKLYAGPCAGYVRLISGYILAAFWQSKKQSTDTLQQDIETEAIRNQMVGCIQFASWLRHRSMFILFRQLFVLLL